MASVDLGRMANRRLMEAGLLERPSPHSFRMVAVTGPVFPLNHHINRLRNLRFPGDPTVGFALACARSGPQGLRNGSQAVSLAVARSLQGRIRVSAEGELNR
jgi:hypothetical protein